MPSPPRRRSRTVAIILLLLAATLVVIAAAGWRGWIPAVPSIAAVLFGPGVGWQNLRSRARLTLHRAGFAVAISIGTVVVLGLAMNAVAIPLTRSHWAAALATVLAGLGVVTLVSSPEGRGAHARQVQAVEPPEWRAGAIIAAACALIAAGGVLIAWYSQQHWLARQHFTELYAIRAGTSEQVTVSNHEGEAVSYTARIAVAGRPVQIVQFTLANGERWTDSVAVEPGLVTSTQPMLDVELSRTGVSGVYRFIRLLRPQPTSLPAPD